MRQRHQQPVQRALLQSMKHILALQPVVHPERAVQAQQIRVWQPVRLGHVLCTYRPAHHTQTLVARTNTPNRVRCLNSMGWGGTCLYFVLSPQQQE